MTASCGRGPRLVRSVVLRIANGHVAQAPMACSPMNLSRTEAYFYSIVMSGIDDTPPTARAAIMETLEGVEGIAHVPDIVIQRNFRPHRRWSRTPRLATRQPAPKNDHNGRTRRAVVSWQSDAEDASLSHVVEHLSSRYPGTHIEIKKR